MLGRCTAVLLVSRSDIDLIVYSKDGRQWKSAELEKIMSDLREAFCRRHICTHEGIQVLNSATVPIIKLTDHITDLKVDMSFNLNNGPRSAQLILVRIRCDLETDLLSQVDESKERVQNRR